MALIVQVRYILPCDLCMPQPHWTRPCTYLKGTGCRSLTSAQLLATSLRCNSKSTPIATGIQAHKCRRHDFHSRIPWSQVGRGYWWSMALHTMVRRSMQACCVRCMWDEPAQCQQH